MEELNRLRDNIDEIDSDILSLFMKRMELCKSVADYKKANNMPVFHYGQHALLTDKAVKGPFCLNHE